MIRRTGAVLCVLLSFAVAATMATPAEAFLKRRAKATEVVPATMNAALQGSVAAAVAEAQAKRARGQRVWCVPFARTATGVDIRGNAETWWAAAAGRYDRGAEPQVGAVMVFSGSRKMPMGHVAVVSALVSDRVIRIDHANWKRNQVSLGMVVHDVSEAGDWSAVRVEGDPGVVGRVNPVAGFIYPQGRQMARAERAPVVRVAYER
jgi:surface antigen